MLKEPAASASTRLARTTVKLEEAAQEQLVPALKKPAASTSARRARAAAEPEEQVVAVAKKPAARRARVANTIQTVSACLLQGLKA